MCKYPYIEKNYLPLTKCYHLDNTNCTKGNLVYLFWSQENITLQFHRLSSRLNHPSSVVVRPSENSLYHHPRGCGSLRLWGAESPNEAIQPPLSTCPLPHPFIWTPDNVPAPTPHISRSFHFKRLRLQFLQLLFLLKLFCLQHTTKNSPLC